VPRPTYLSKLQARWGPLPLRAINVLIRAGVDPARVPALRDWELHAIKDLGPRVFQEIRAVYPSPDAEATPAHERTKAS
jgi:hypothetical protein